MTREDKRGPVLNWLLEENRDRDWKGSAWNAQYHPERSEFRPACIAIQRYVKNSDNNPRSIYVEVTQSTVKFDLRDAVFDNVLWGELQAAVGEAKAELVRRAVNP